MKVSLSIINDYREPNRIALNKYNPFEKRLTIKPITKEKIDTIKK